MSEAEIRKYDPDDKELRAIMEDKFHDGKFPDNGEKPVDNSAREGAFLKPCERSAAAESAGASKDTTEGKSAAKNAFRKFKTANIGFLSLYAKSAAFGGLTGLLYCWMNTGLMAESAAVPSMIVCSALFGLGIGKVIGGDCK